MTPSQVRALVEYHNNPAHASDPKVRETRIALSAFAELLDALEPITKVVPQQLANDSQIALDAFRQLVDVLRRLAIDESSALFALVNTARRIETL